MTTKTRYTVTSPVTGVVHSRNSSKSHYTHAVVVTLRREDGTMREIVSFCGSLELAQKAKQAEVANWPTKLIDANIVQLEG